MSLTTLCTVQFLMSHLVIIMAMMICMRGLMEVGNDEHEDDDDDDFDNAEM